MVKTKVQMSQDGLDPLITECPNCDTRFRVTEAQLQVAQGRVRCGACLGVFDGTEHLLVDGEVVRAPEASTDVDDVLNELEVTPIPEAGRITAPALQPDSADTQIASRVENRPESAGEPRLVGLPDRLFAAASKASTQADPNPAEADSFIEPHPVSQSQPQPESELGLQPQPEPQPEPEAEPQPGPEPEPEREPQPELENPLPNLADGSRDPSPVALQDPDETEQLTPEDLDTLDLPEELEALEAELVRDEEERRRWPQPSGSKVSAEDQLIDEILAQQANEQTQRTPMPQGQTAVPQTTVEDQVVSTPLRAMLAAKSIPSVGVKGMETDQGVEPETLVVQIPEVVPDWEPEDRSRVQRSRATLVLTLLAIVALPVQLLVFQFDSWVKEPSYRPIYEQWCKVANCTLAPLRDLSKIVSNRVVIRTHPTHDDATIIDVLMVNDAEFAQPFPLIEIMAMNERRELIAGRRFEPVEYLQGEFLDGERTVSDLLPARTPVHVSFEVKNPDQSVTNFEVNYR